MSQPKALIVDDEDELREALRDEMTSENWVVDDTRDGREALELFKNKHFDVIISDIRMPGIDGMRLLREIRKNNLDCIFVLMSAFADVPIWESYASGANAFFGKPFRIQDLEDLLTRMRKPTLQRWSDPKYSREHIQVSNHIEVPDSEVAEHFSLGRGGMFVDPGPNNARKGQVLSFRIHTPEFLLQGIGKVLWKRPQSEAGLAPGLGIEFLFLDESCRHRVAEAAGRTAEKAFVPSGILLKGS